MYYETFSKAVPEMLLASTLVLQQLESCTPADDCDRAGFIEARDRVIAKIEDVQARYNEDVKDLDEAIFTDLAEIDEQLSFMLHHARASVDYRTFLHYKRQQTTLHFETRRALGRNGPVETA